MSRLTWEEARAKAINDKRNPHYVRGRRAKKYNPHYYRMRYGLKAYMRELAKNASPSDTFRVTFYGEHRSFKANARTWNGGWEGLSRNRQIMQTKSGTNRSGEIDSAAQAEAYNELCKLGVRHDQITFEKTEAAA